MAWGRDLQLRRTTGVTSTAKTHKIVASGGDDQMIQLRRLPNAMMLWSVALDATLTALALTPSHALIVGTTQGLVVLEFHQARARPAARQSNDAAS
jgi:hypothetical protein